MHTYSMYMYIFGTGQACVTFFCIDPHLYICVIYHNDENSDMLMKIRRTMRKMYRRLSTYSLIYIYTFFEKGENA